MGAGAVALVPCSASGCPLAYDDHAAANAAYARDLLTAVGATEDRVRAEAAGPVPKPWPVAGIPGPFRPAAAAVVLSQIAAARHCDDADVPGVAAPAGVVTIDAAACTLCGECAQACPTGALEADRADGTVSLTFDAAGCPACGQCVPRCPEAARGAIRLRRTVNVAALGAGRQVLFEGAARA